MQRSVLSTSAVFVLIGALAGCGTGGDGLARVPLRGAVRVGTVPAAEGQVRFVPSQSNSGPVAAAAIREGRYEFSTSEGPTKGPHDVIVEVRGTAPASSPDAPAQPGAKGGGASGVQSYKTTVIVDPATTEVDLQLAPANATAS